MSKVFSEAEVSEVRSNASIRIFETISWQFVVTITMRAPLQHNNEKSCWLIIGNDSTGEFLCFGLPSS